MDNNVNFRQDLIITYLNYLANMNNKEEFDKWYPSVEDYLQTAMNNALELEVLEMIKNIISFKTRTMSLNNN